MTTANTDAAAAPAGERQPLLVVDDLQVEFRTREGTARAVNGVSYSVDRGRTLAVLGESGSGKSVTAQAIMGIIDSPPGFVTGGRVMFDGIDLLALPEDERRRYRGRRIAMIFQDALSALNPVHSVGRQIGEMFTTHEGMSRKAARARAVDLMDRVGIPAAASRADDYPHQFSGGMRQRIMIAMAIALGPDILIADEPTTALDVTVQAQVMELLAALKTEAGMGLILITHDLGVVADVADDIAVMYAGRIVERGPVHPLYRSPRHPYTKGLLDSIPRVDQHGEELYAIKGLPPSLLDLPSGCSFRPRCPLATDRCATERPELRTIGTDRVVACHHAEEVSHG